MIFLECVRLYMYSDSSNIVEMKVINNDFEIC